jgi:hypothetical protein
LVTSTPHQLDYSWSSVLSEGDIREATRRRLGDRWAGIPETLIVDEMGTHFGSSRIDLAVVNGALWGHEIKSAADRLGRLPGQVAAFDEVFDYLTVVAAEKHMQRCSEIVSDWWGLVEAKETKTGALLRERRKPRRNLRVLPEVQASLLWRNELLDALEAIDAATGVRSATRDALVRRLAAELSPTELGAVVRDTIRARPAWRGDAQRTQCDEMKRPLQRSSGFLARRVRQQRPRYTGLPR